MDSSGIPRAVNRIFETPTIVLIIAVDSLLILSTYAKSDLPHLSENKYSNWIISNFNLAVEMNLSVWWSSVLLFLISILAYQKYLKTERSVKISWAIISMLFLGMSIDEIGSLHERILSLGFRIPFITICLVVLSYSLYSLFNDSENRRAAIYISMALILFGFAVIQEYLEHALKWPPWALGLRTVVEEGTELAGSLLGLIGVSSCRDAKIMSHPICFLPEASTVWSAKNVFAILLIGHILLSSSFYSWAVLSESGNPTVFFPLIMYGTLFLYSVSEIFYKRLRHHFLQRWSPLIWLVSSAIIPYVYVGSIQLTLHQNRSILDTDYLISYLTLFHAIQFLLCGWFLFNDSKKGIQKVVPIILAISSTFVCLLFYRFPTLVFTLIGINSFIFFRLVASGENPEELARIEINR